MDYKQEGRTLFEALLVVGTNDMGCVFLSAQRRARFVRRTAAPSKDGKAKPVLGWSGGSAGSSAASDEEEMGANRLRKAFLIGPVVAFGPAGAGNGLGERPLIQSL